MPADTGVPKHSFVAEPLVPDPVEIHKEFVRDVHADVDFNRLGRASLVQAAEAWRKLTKGRVHINVIFDLDFDLISNLKAHRDAKDTLLVGVLSEYPIVNEIDRATNRGNRATTLAVTAGLEYGATGIFLIMDRIRVDAFLSVAIHEFGHLAGLPDLPSHGSVMSGASIFGETPVVDFTEDDKMLCRVAAYCD